MPEFVRTALESEGLQNRYDQRPWYQRNDYLGWIRNAKREETKQKRLNQMLHELRTGDIYMKMDWRTRAKSDK
ncbi:MAG: YdeI/OmpD-associated family protein [Rhizobiaceae bacterium]